MARTRTRSRSRGSTDCTTTLCLFICFMLVALAIIAALGWYFTEGTREKNPSIVNSTTPSGTTPLVSTPKYVTSEPAKSSQLPEDMTWKPQRDEIEPVYFDRAVSSNPEPEILLERT